MTRRIVQNQLTGPVGYPVSEQPIAIKLSVPAAFSLSGQVETLHTNHVVTDATGFWQAPLEPNDQLDPTGTFYVVDEKYQTWNIVVPVGTTPMWLRQVLAQVPPTPSQIALTAGVPTFIQETEPTQNGPWVWYPIDSQGTILDWIVKAV